MKTLNPNSQTFTHKSRSQRARWVTALCLLPCSLAPAAEMFAARIFSSTQAVAAVNAGDFDPVHPGKELAGLMADGSVVELALGPSGWTANTIFTYRGSSEVRWQGPTMRATLSVGDVLSPHAGQVLVLSFLDQVVVVYHVPGAGWTNHILADLSGLVATSWGAEIGDCNPTRAGQEVFAIVEHGFDSSVGTAYSEAGGNWQANDVYSGEVGMDAAIGDSNPDHPGDEIIVVTEMGPAYEITPPAGGGSGPWPRRTIWNDPTNAGWVVKIGDVDPDSPGNEIVYGTRSTDRIMMSHHNGPNPHNVGILFTGVNTNSDINNMLDVAIGQVFPASPAAEILGVDASGSVYGVQRGTNQWYGSILWRDTNALYALAVADLLPTPGDEVVVAGASGTMTLLLNPSPILSLASTPARQAVLSWNGIAGLTYAVETTTHLPSGSSWQHVTNLVHQGGFSGVLSYTNAPGDSAARFFRVRVCW